jgi:predicted acetyltransferase
MEVQGARAHDPCAEQGPGLKPLRWTTLPYTICAPRMNLTISIAGYHDRDIVRNLIQLYFHDFSEYDGEDVRSSGRYDADWVEEYWEHPNAAYVFHVGSQVAGFCLVDHETLLVGSENAIAEFFVLRKYRRSGIGLQAAVQVLMSRPGVWEVSQIAANAPAQSFWRRVASRVGANGYAETLLDDERWHGPVQQFVVAGTVRQG